MEKFSLKFVILSLFIILAHGRFVDLEKSSKYDGSMNGGINDFSGMQNRKLHHKQRGNFDMRNPRLSEAEWSTYSIREPNGPGTFAFGYDNVMDSAGNEHYRSEERFENGTVIGEYGYTDNVINRIVRVTYTADHRGYRAKTQILPL